MYVKGFRERYQLDSENTTKEARGLLLLDIVSLRMEQKSMRLDATL